MSSSDEEEGTVAKPCMSQEAMLKLYEMHLNNTLCDATLIMDDGRVFNVHRAMMCACSSYFRALFTTSLNEDRIQFEIPGIESKLMEQMISFAYLRHVQNVCEDNVFDLFACADYCSMLGLMKICVNYIISILRPENCIKIMLFARFHTITELLDKSRLYILKNFVQVADKSEELMELDIDDFFNIVNDELLNVKDEQTVWECCVKWIDHDSENRIGYLGRLLKAIRLGLLNNTYFMEQVRNHQYIVSCPEAKPIITDTIKFLYDLEQFNVKSVHMTTPPLALPRLPHEVIFAIGGWSEGMPQRHIETYDTRADRWVRVFHEDHAGPRAYHGTAVIGNKIYCIGGFDGMEYFNTCRCFDAVKKTWKEIAPMHNKRCYVSVTELNGRIYALGGYDGHTRQNTAEVYDPTTNQWTFIPPMHFQRSDADACTLNSKVYITGGFNGQECLNTAECYDPQTRSWSLITNMTSRRSGVSCVAYRGLLYVIGGFNGLSRLNSGEKYDPIKKTWSPIKEMYHPRSNFGMEIIDDMIFAIGGFNGIVTISHTECYVPESDEWLEATDMGMVRSALTANVVSGLPNVRDYIHQNRHNLMEERHRIIYGADNEELGGDRDMDIDLDIDLEEDEDDDIMMADDEIA